MEVSAEAKRIMVVALGKLYSSRTQRGGLRLHRSLLLTRLMKSARDMYHAAQAADDAVASACEPQASAARAGPAGVHPEPRGAAGTPPDSPREEAAGSPAERRGARVRTGGEDKENLCPTGPGQRPRKRRAKAAVEPDFLPRKKAKLEQRTRPQQLVVSPSLVDYVNCGTELVAAPIPLQRAISAC